jgi:hypothetical protein
MQEVLLAHDPTFLHRLSPALGMLQCSQQTRKKLLIVQTPWIRAQRSVAGC